MIARTLSLLAIAAVPFAGTPTAGAAPSARSAQPAEIRAVEIGPSLAPRVGPALMGELRAAGITTLVIEDSRLRSRQARRLKRLATAAGLPVTDPALFAQTLETGLELAAQHPSELVVARAGSSQEILSLPPDQYRGRILVLLPLAEPPAALTTWQDTLTAAAENAHLDLGVAPSGASWRESLDAYLELLAAGEPPPDPPAEIFVSPGGSDGGVCTREAPCASFDRAYRVAQPGQVVEVAAGTYPAQTITSDPSKLVDEDVILRPAPGAQVTITGALIVEASHIELRSFMAGFWKSRLASDQTFRNLDVGLFFIHGSNGVTVSGGDVGPYDNDDSQIASLQGRVPTDIVIEYVFFHDARKTDPSAHTECLQIGSGIRVTIRGNRFDRCSDHDIFIRSWGNANKSPHPLQDFTIENNFFGKVVRGYYSLRLSATTGWPCERFVVRNNSALTNMYSTCEARDVRFIANLQPSKTRQACEDGGGVWDYNVYGEGEACGTHDTIAPLGYTDPDTLDLHLSPGSAALGHAPPEGVAATDIDGQRRPRGDRPDAGADERR